MVNEKNIGNAKHFSSDDLRFATPLNVAKRRAEDLKCDTIVDLCSGIGIQAGAFAKICSWAYGFEIDERKVEYSKKNFDLKNLKFHVGDVMDEDVIERVKKIQPDVIFCDPERLPSEKERNLDSIKPDLRKLTQVYGKICKNLCIEVPPRIDLEKLQVLGDFEAEYLSLDNKLNRLDLKFGNLKKDEVSVVDVDSGTRLARDNKIKSAKSSEKILKYLFEASEAILKAGLEKEFSEESNSFILNGCEKNRLLFTSTELISNDLEVLCKSYIVFGSVDSPSEVNSFLRKHGFGKVLIKYAIDPKDYWKDRNLFERGLRGNKEGVIFKINNCYVICEEYY